MGLFTRDAWDDVRDERIALIGQAAYDKEVKEYIEKYDREHPNYPSKSEPIVHRGDVITNDRRFGTEFYITRITEEGDIFGTMISNNPMQDDLHLGGEYKWEGVYMVVGPMRGEYDTVVCGPLGAI